MCSTSAAAALILYVLQMSYDEGALASIWPGTSESMVFLASYDSTSGHWVNSVMANTGNDALGGELAYQGSFAQFQNTYGDMLPGYIGAYGVDMHERCGLGGIGPQQPVWSWSRSSRTVHARNGFHRPSLPVAVGLATAGPYYGILALVLLVGVYGIVNVVRSLISQQKG